MIAAAENAILARLRAAETGPRPLGYGWKTLESAPEDLAALFADTVAGVATPAAWVGFTGWDRVTDTGGSHLLIEGARFVLIVAAHNLRNERAARHGGADAGAAGEVGSYQLLADATRLLTGWADDAVAMDRLAVGAAREVRTSSSAKAQRINAWALPISCDLHLDSAIDGDGDAAPFTHFHADWDVPPIGAGRDGTAIGAPLPDPANADAADDVMLPGDLP